MTNPEQQILITDELLPNTNIYSHKPLEVSNIIEHSYTIPINTKLPENVSTTESINAVLNSLFPEQDQDEKEIKQVKSILGELSNKLTSEELHVLVCEVKYLVENWLDEYETTILEGRTLKEILNEG